MEWGRGKVELGADRYQFGYEDKRVRHTVEPTRITLGKGRGHYVIQIIK